MKEKEFLEEIKKNLGKKVLPLSLAGTLMFNVGVMNASAKEYQMNEPKTTYQEYLNYDGVKVFVNGRYVDFDNDLGYPVGKNGRNYVPVRVVAETFGAKVTWDKWEQKVIICKGKERIELFVGSNKIVYISDATKMDAKEVTSTIDAKPFFHNDRTYVPIRAIFEYFGCDVKWDGNTKTITVTSKNFTDNLGLNGKQVSIKDVDTSKFNNIFYDGVEITKDYVNLLKNCNDYKVFDEGDRLYIFSYQYLYELNNMYKTYKSTLKSGEWDNLYVNTDVDKKADFLLKATMVDFKLNNCNLTKDTNYFLGDYFEIRAFGSDAYKSTQDEIDKIVNQIKSTTSDKVEQIKLANNILCDKFDYELTYEIDYFVVVDAFKNNTTKCQGYAEAFKLIMNGLNIPCILTIGTANGCHSWNEVFVNGEWKVVDVTWNDTCGDRNKYLLVDTPSTHSQTERTEDDIVKLTYKFE